MKSIDEITGAVLDCAIKIHSEFGPGLLESVYECILARMLEKRGFAVEAQKQVSFEYDGMFFENAFRLDLLVDGKVIVELKSAERNMPVYGKQLKTYLKLTGMQVGLLVNFGMSTLKEGVVRVVNGFDEAGSVLRVNRPEAQARGDAEG